MIIYKSQINNNKNLIEISFSAIYWLYPVGYTECNIYCSEHKRYISYGPYAARRGRPEFPERYKWFQSWSGSIPWKLPESHEQSWIPAAIPPTADTTAKPEYSAARRLCAKKNWSSEWSRCAYYKAARDTTTKEHVSRSKYVSINEHRKFAIGRPVQSSKISN